jgi:acetylornithine deacetylase/succinyl-diaminopimelate desuccinylase-like protein
VDPWSGEVRDGCVWGRGALDMKSQVAAEIAASVALASEGWRPEAGELLIAAVVDEEAGGAHGAQWLCREQRDKVRCDLLVNEGAGDVFEFDGRRVFTVCVAEKGVCRFQLVTRGRAGHASVPTTRW